MRYYSIYIVFRPIGPKKTYVEELRKPQIAYRLLVIVRPAERKITYLKLPQALIAFVYVLM